MNIKQPIGAWILVERIQPKKQEGQLLNDITTKDYMECVVIEVGTGVILANGVRSTFDVKKGDKLLAKNFAGITLQQPGEELTFLYQSDILAILK